MRFCKYAIFPGKNIKLLFKWETALLHIDRVVPPSFIRKLKNTNAVLGTSAVLECRVSGSAPISVGWFQDGNEIVSGPKCQWSFSENVCTLNLSLLEPSDAGTYTCVAANVAGSAECSAVLAVQGQCAAPPGASSLRLGACLVWRFYFVLMFTVPFSPSSSHLDFFLS